MGGIGGELFRTAKGLVLVFAVLCLFVGVGAASSIGRTAFTVIGQGLGIVVSGLPDLASGFKQTGPTDLGAVSEGKTN